MGEDFIKFEDEVIGRDKIMVNLTTSDFPEYTGLYNLKITTKPDTDFLAGDTPMIYTDGSKMQAGVGAAFTVYERGEFIHNYKISMKKT